MTPIKVQMLYYEIDTEEDEFQFKTLYLDADKISAFYILDPDTVDGIEYKCYGITCDGEFYSVKPEPEIYNILFQKFIKPTMKKK